MSGNIDELVLGVAQEEYEQSMRALKADSPERARRTSQRRLDSVLAGQSRQGLACRDGCHLCCYLRVVAYVPEVFGFIEYLKAELTADDFAQFITRVLEAATRVESLSQHEHIHTNIACPALSNGRCLGYAARPMMCRKYHATDVKICQDAYDFPLKDDARNAVLPLREAVGDAHLQGWRTALQDSGFDADPYEFIKALREALLDGEAKQRFHNRQPTFTFAADEVLMADDP